MKLRLPHKAISWALLAGTSYVLCFPQFDLPLFSLLFFPSLLFCLHELKSRKQAWLLGLLLSSMVAVGGFHWIVYVAQNFGEMPLPAAIGLLGLFCLVAAPQMILILPIGWHWRYRVETLPPWLRPLFWASLYTGLEFLARFTKIFPEHLGNTMLPFSAVSQSASLAGVALLTFLPVAIGAGLYYARIDRRCWPALLAALLLTLGLHIWGVREEARVAAQPSETLNVGMVQHNMEEVEKIAQRTGGRHAIEAIITKLIEATDELASAEPHPDLIVWPETSYPILFASEASRSGPVAQGYANLVKQAAARTGVPLLIGAYENDGTYDYNAAILLGADGNWVDSYRKNVLLIFGEYFPGDRWFPDLKKLNPIMGDFGRGPGAKELPFTFKGRSLPLGVNICYEAILPEYMRGYGDGKTRLLVNVTKDSWFGNTFEPWQHFQLSVLRSIELRIPMVRVTNTGLTGVITPTGKWEIISPPYQTKVKTLPVQVPLQIDPTPYARFGDWFPTLLLFFCAGILLWLRKKKPA